MLNPKPTTNRRDFFARTGEGLLGVALAQLLCRDVFGNEKVVSAEEASSEIGTPFDLTPKAAASPSEANVGHSVVHERRAQPNGLVRSQAGSESHGWTAVPGQRGRDRQPKHDRYRGDDGRPVQNAAPGKVRDVDGRRAAAHRGDGG